MDLTPVKTSVGRIFQPSPLLHDIKSPSSPSLSFNAKSAKDLVIKFNKLVDEWKQLNAKSAVVIQSISQTKIKHFEENEFYPKELESIFYSIDDARNGFVDIVYSMKTVLNQFEALSKLCSASEVLVSTWSADYLLEIIKKIVNAYETELEAKKRVSENIAHTKESSQLALYNAVWIYEVYLRDIYESLISLNTEMGVVC